MNTLKEFMMKKLIVILPLLIIPLTVQSNEAIIYNHSNWPVIAWPIPYNTPPRVLTTIPNKR